MTIYGPDGHRARGMAAVYFAPTVADLQAPSMTEFASPTGFAVHCEIDEFSLSVSQNKVSLNRFCLSEPVQKWGDTTYELGDLEVIYNPQDLEDPAYSAAGKMLAGTSWVLLYRLGLASATVPLEEGQLCHVIPVNVGTPFPKDISGDEGEELKMIIPLLVSAPPAWNVTLAA